ncbi:hypothetical protein GXW83_13725 [Streptacidiphilus sp. PB12-B1b]|uniref:hypothetical protein n=1 Tax=Streptacidiphilus sp. PB12-B1b TaxID=2705012 RepID=UPI0015FAF3E5|nr:hypothetical protein [Streptacidiphilus sp. PB12-B1b]QMU76647.1 hypothetical protein GXW83_13725 [Streptacidiphilus sp. PB12-B1b]
MGVLYGYFAAVDDDDALRAVVRDDDEPSGSGYDQVETKGIGPTVELLPAEALVTGLPAEEIRSQPRHGGLVGISEGGDLVVVSLTDAFRDALAAADAASLRGVGAAWAATEGAFHSPPDAGELGGFLEQLSALAGRAVTRGLRLYCWICA